MLYFIVNPIAGKGKTIRVFKRVRELLDEKQIKYDYVFTEYVGHAEELARAACTADRKHIIAVGGDGTVREVGCGMNGADAALGIIPAGSGNDLARSLRISSKVEDAINALLAGAIRRIDIGMAGDTMFFNAAGLGFDVNVLLALDKAKRFLAGSAAYAVSVIMAICNTSFISAEIEIDGKTIKRDLLLMAICNGTYYGGGMKVAPGAEIDDGIFEVHLINKLPKWRIPMLLPKFMNGSYVSLSVAEHYRASKITVRALPVSKLQLDGAIMGETPTDFSIMPASLNVIVPV